MLRLLIPMTILLGSPAPAQNLVPRIPEPACVLTDGPDSCVRIVACIGQEGRWFRGRSFGSGSLVGTMSDGVTCEGAWAIEPSGKVRAEVSCDDGTSGGVISEYQDRPTGTTVGKGVMSSGEAIHSFTGRNVIDFLMDDGVPTLPCDTMEIEIHEDSGPIS